jgi:hypothetical protein
VTDNIKLMLTIGPILACAGIAWTALKPSDLSSTAVLIGLLTAIWGTHKFGRLGLDEPEPKPAPDDATDGP